MNTLKRPIAFAFLVLCAAPGSRFTAPAQTVDNIGSEFILGFMPNTDQRDTFVELFLTSSVAASVTVEYPVIGPTFTTTVDVMPGQVTIVDLGPEPAFAWTPGAVDSNVVRVFSDDEFVVYAGNRQDASTDVAVALPVDALGTEYLVQSYTQHYEFSAFAVAAPFDGTTVTITPSADLMGGHTAGTPFEIMLDRGEGFLGQSLGDDVTDIGDLTGTIIESNQPVQVSNGHVCAPVNDPFFSCDHLFEVAQPVPGWGLDALAAPSPYEPEGTFYRILASEGKTTVEQNGAMLAVLDRAEFFDTPGLMGAQVFAADRPILVTQLLHSITGSNGDPSMMTVLPTAQYLQAYTFSTIGGNQFSDDYATIIAEDADVAGGTILFDGVPITAAEFTSMAGTGFSYATLSIADGTHSTSSDGVHAVVISGFDPFDTYLYHGGMMFENPLSPLPVALATFEAGPAVEPGVELTWQTFSEANNAGFEVERSVDGGPFEALAFVAGRGTTSELQSYSFTDTTFPFDAAGLTYRLRQIDFDGTVKDELTWVDFVNRLGLGVGERAGADTERKMARAGADGLTRPV